MSDFVWKRRSALKKKNVYYTYPSSSCLLPHKTKNKRIHLQHQYILTLPSMNFSTQACMLKNVH